MLFRYISVKNKKGKYKSFKVPDEIYTYILQLESYILNSKKSKLKELYPDKFKK